jgi:hypothetical protein
VIADIHRQVVEYRALGDALQSFDSNIADGKRRALPAILREIQAARDKDRLQYRWPALNLKRRSCDLNLELIMISR